MQFSTYGPTQSPKTNKSTQSPTTTSSSNLTMSPASVPTNNPSILSTSVSVVAIKPTKITTVYEEEIMAETTANIKSTVIAEYDDHQSQWSTLWPIMIVVTGVCVFGLCICYGKRSYIRIREKEMANKNDVNDNHVQVRKIELEVVRSNTIDHSSKSKPVSIYKHSQSSIPTNAISTNISSVHRHTTPQPVSHLDHDNESIFQDDGNHEIHRGTNDYSEDNDTGDTGTSGKITGESGTGESDELDTELNSANGTPVIDVDDEKGRKQTSGAIVEDKVNLKSEEGLKHWLLNVVGLPEYYDAFIQNGYETLELVKEIENKHELNEIGIVYKGHQYTILAEIWKLKDQNTPLSNQSTIRYNGHGNDSDNDRYVPYQPAFEMMDQIERNNNFSAK